MVTAVMAQPAEPTVSVAELPRGAPAQAASCWPMMAMLIELSAEAVTGPPRVDARAKAAATVAARRPMCGVRNFTDRQPRLDGGTSAAHLGGGRGRKQTTTVTQGA